MVGKFLESKKVAVLVGLKTGQMEEQKAREVKQRVERSGRECILICCREITPENLNSFTDIDLFVNTACPRIALDDSGRFLKPIVNSQDVEPYIS